MALRKDARKELQKTELRTPEPRFHRRGSTVPRNVDYFFFFLLCETILKREHTDIRVLNKSHAVAPWISRCEPPVDFAHGTHGSVPRPAGTGSHSAAVAHVPGAPFLWIYELRCLLSPGYSTF